MKAEVRRLDFSEEALRALTSHQRYVFALVGHIFNELTLLQKWIHVSRRPPGSPGPQEDAAVGVTLFLFRLLSAKVYEALHKDALRSESVDQVLRADYFEGVAGLNDEWTAVLGKYENMEWLSWIRNKGGFHYLNQKQWESGLEGSMCEGGYAYVGKRYGDTYFHWAEMCAALPAMKHVNPSEPLEGFQQMVNDLAQLAGEVTHCLARGLQKALTKSEIGAELSDPICFEAPPLEPLALHYFFADDRLE